MTDFPPLAGFLPAMQRALENPIDAAPMADTVRLGNKVAVMTGDRFTDELFGTRGGLGHKLLDYLNGLGAPDGDHFDLKKSIT